MRAVAAALLALALAATPLSFTSPAGRAAATGPAAGAPLPTLFAARAPAPLSADPGGLRPLFVRAPLAVGGGDHFEAGCCPAAELGRIARGHQSAWGRLQLDGG